jgi:hypothetical protein
VSGDGVAYEKSSVSEYLRRGESSRRRRDQRTGLLEEIVRRKPAPEAELDLQISRFILPSDGSIAVVAIIAIRERRNLTAYRIAKLRLARREGR